MHLEILATTFERFLPTVYIFAYIALFYALVFAYLLARKRKLNRRWPLATKVRRQAGHSLEKRIRKWDENGPTLILFSPLLPLFLGLSVVIVLETLIGQRPILHLSIGTIVFATTLIWSTSNLLLKFRQFACDSLGLYGERVV